MVYKPFKLHLSKGQAIKATKSQPIKLRHSQLNSGPYVVLLHPANFKILHDAFTKKRGATITMGPGEIEATKASEMQGTGIFDFFKKAYNWVKGNWSSIKPIVSSVADVALPALGTAFGAPEAGIAGRALLKQTTGVGMVPKKRMPMKGKGLYLGKSGNGLYL